MKKTFKSVAAMVVLAYFTLASVFGSNLSFTGTVATNVNLFLSQSPAQATRAGGITLLTIANPNTSAVAVRLFDSPTTNISFVAAAYTNITRSVVSITNIYTDPLGASVTNIYNGVTNTQSTVAQATVGYRTIGFFNVSSNSTYSIPYSSPDIFNLGLTITNNGGITISVDYLPF